MKKFSGQHLKLISRITDGKQRSIAAELNISQQAVSKLFWQKNE